MICVTTKQSYNRGQRGFRINAPQSLKPKGFQGFHPVKALRVNEQRTVQYLFTGDVYARGACFPFGPLRPFVDP